MTIMPATDASVRWHSLELLCDMIALPPSSRLVHLPEAERLQLLNTEDRLRKWQSLSDVRVCMCCDRKLTGRTLRIFDAGNRYFFKCPTAGCTGGLAEFAIPGDPFADDSVWLDWQKTLSATDDLDPAVSVA